MISVKAALLSVIIPVYNVEPYLEECLNSVINQTYKNLEIICVNDGSTDNSWKILEKFAKKDNRIKLINQKNQGAAAARNAGLDLATGEYITFVDSDDYLELEAYEEAMKVMLNDKSVDLVEFGVQPFLQTNDSRLKRYIKILESKNGRKRMLFNALYNKIYVSKIINKTNMRIVNITSPEDYFFNINYKILSTDNHVRLKQDFYKYRQHMTAITKTNFHSNARICYGFNCIINIAKKNGVYKANKLFLYDEYVKCIRFYKHDMLIQEVTHLDNSLLNSDCPYDIKEKYMQKRGYIEYILRRPFEVKIYELMKKVKDFSHNIF